MAVSLSRQTPMLTCNLGEARTPAKGQSTLSFMLDEIFLRQSRGHNAATAFTLHIPEFNAISRKRNELKNRFIFTALPFAPAKGIALKPQLAAAIANIRCSAVSRIGQRPQSARKSSP